jgi:hypothetical protein
MARTLRWNEELIVDGVMSITLTSWKYFHDYVRQEMLDFSHYVWRGQLDSVWRLESGLDRALKVSELTQRSQIARGHLEKFKLAVRGRRGQHPSKIEDENEWWALGQHHGLATPLLDWTESPFVALYFAFESRNGASSGFRSVWALGPVFEINKKIREGVGGLGDAPTLDFIRPHQDENSRLVSQAGLFTRVPLGQTVDGWVKKNCEKEKLYATLIHLRIPDRDREECLRTLNKMNISHLTLFPDVHGASLHCNKIIEIPKY